MSRSRRRWGWGSTVAFALLALAPACGAPTAAGFRPGTGGGGGGPATDGGGTGGSNTDAMVTAEALPPFDGGGCTDNGSQSTDPSMTAATGTFSGALAGAVCTGGAFAYVQSTPADDGGAPDVELLIATVGTGDPDARVRFQNRPDITDGALDVDIGISAAASGTYTQDVTCGSVALLADLSAPDPGICATDAGGFNCPDGCESTGPSQPCTPIPPQATYAALAASDCRGDLGPAMGNWTVTLTSLTLEPDAGTGTLGSAIYKAHGTLTATLADQDTDTDAGTGTVTLTLSF
jgi:hypothetical protein